MSIKLILKKSFIPLSFMSSAEFLRLVFTSATALFILFSLNACSKPDNDVDALLSLAKKSGCFSCHALDQKLLGPAWNAVADKYRDDPGAKEQLIEKIRVGGGGVWGDIEMPPAPSQMSGNDIELLVTYVLALTK
ncbi:MAG: cytochrome C [Gammaproteobacteria bacterium]|nr:cytochrome C [Gammaproteobacteria bacterium]